MRNNWYVLTGAPSSGKTTILKLLEDKGRTVQYEWARIYIDEEIKNGKTIQEIRRDEAEFQRKILELKIDFEKTLDPKMEIFMERGIPDSIAYMKLSGLKDHSVLNQALKNCSYKKVFLIELIKYDATDYARTESQEEAILLDRLLEQSYKDCGIEVIRVPKMSVKKRVQFILNNL